MITVTRRRARVVTELVEVPAREAAVNVSRAGGRAAVTTS